MFPYKSPELCSRCGSSDAVKIWKVNKMTTPFNIWAFLTTWFGINIPRYESNTFLVPICSLCEAKLESIRNTTRGITISLAVLLGLLFGIVFLVKGVSGNNLVVGLLITLLVTLFGAMFGIFGGIIFGLIVQEALNYEFCDYDGRFYHFENKKFRREFALLNPSLVKQKKK